MDETPIETLIENKTTFTPEGDDYDDDSSVELDENVAYQSLSDSDSDDEFKKITHFSAEAAYDILYNQLSYTKIFLDYDLQKELSLEIGCHVSNEHPWKTVKKELLEEYLTDSTVETENLKAKLSLFDGNDSVLLVGYHCPPGEESSEDGVFIVYDEIESILIATELIKKLEIWKRFQVKRALIKKPSRTIVPSRLDLLPKEPPRPRISVELQTSHTETVRKAVQFSFRTSSDCRDGYLELRPLKTETFQNVHRKRIAQGIQSAAQRIDRAQQTDPTFPTNAHTQYSYEIQSEGREEEAGKEEDKESEVVEPEEAPKPGTVAEVEKGEGDQSEEDGEETLLSTEAASQHKPVAVSKQIKELIRTLEFNQIDMYRIEYQTIGAKEIPKFRVPFLEELFCFADIGRTGQRRVSHIEWHPKYSGLFVATYTWDTLSTFVPSQNDPKADPINKIILQPNYIFMWSLEDSLSPVLAFESPREVSTVSFHPLDPTCLIGGLVNGQVIIWDLTEIVEGLGASEDDSKYREDMRKFLNWTKHSSGKDTVKRSAISCLEFSPTERITNIKWLNSNIYLSSTGEIRESSDGKQGHRYFVTSSMDGTIAFWNMADGSIPEEKQVVSVDEKKKGRGNKKKPKTPVPELKAPSRTKFAHFDRKFRPQFVVVMQEPISSFGLNAARFFFSPIEGGKIIRDLSKKIIFQAEEIPYALEREFTVEDEEEGAFRNNILATTLSGDVVMIKWKSQDADAAACLNRPENLILNPFPSVHDGPVVAMDKNQLMPLLVITIGQNTVAIWRTDYVHGAIYWQRREAELTDCKFSITRPSAFFLTRVDGCVEIWDLISSTQEPCLIETISGGILTTVSQHLLPLSADLLAVGDHNSNVRVFKLPKTFTQFPKEDEDRFVEQINKEVARKEKLRLWQNQWRVDNEDILNAKWKLKEKERIPSPVKQIFQTSTGDGHSRKKTTKKTHPKKQKSIIENSELKWQQMNMKRLMAIMTTIKDIDPKECNQKTLPIREQRAYSLLKKAAIKREFSKVESDFAEMRSRILPVKENIKDRKEIVSKLVRETILSEEFNEKEFEERMERKLQELASDRPKLSLTEIKLRGRHTREILNKSSGGNFVHKEMYEHFKKGRIGSSVSHLKSSTSSPDKAMFSINETEF